ncbi:uncharacterized protein LOC116851984 [Odontomachus brunneus]|uniref:uncharacterized protein LOC116851984 n=1 Tax=Odontomachus brunneus TaxID=486640 RepID=UPI0013F2AA91|nr:uncharacterized protein LOC116851984 [Odontomachus brunneus]
MICVKSLQLELNRVLLLSVGLWPFEQSIFVRLQFIFFYSILLTSIACQLATLVTSQYTPQLIIEVFSVVFFFVIFTIKYSAFSFLTDTVRNLLEIIQHTYNELKDESEVAIIEKYGTIAKRYTYVLTLVSMFGIFLFMFLPFWPRIFNVVWSANESHSYSLLQIRAEYFCNQEKYFYLILLHTNAVFCIGGTAIVATGTIIIVYLQYVCGMLKIASYRMNQALKINTIKINNMQNEYSAYKMIIYAIDMHRKAMKFLRIFMFKHELTFFFLILFGTVATSLNLYRIFRELTTECDYMKLMTPFIFLNTLYIYMFISNNMGQDVINHNEHLFATVYNTQWYAAPLRIQKIILFLLQRGTKSFYVTIGGVFVASLEGFSTLMSTSISYFTVIYSTG